MQQPKVVIAGATGLVGQGAVRHFASIGWRVFAISRRRPVQEPGVHWLRLDLRDPQACRETLATVADATHVVYAAVFEAPGLVSGWSDDEVIRSNALMLQNLMEPLLLHANVQHVSLLQGTKAYGMHHQSVGWSGVRNPLRESDPRAVHPNFYFDQEDYLRERQRSAAWGLAIFRPTVVYGDATGNNMNLIPVIGAWAELLRDDGEPLHFPGRRLSLQLKEAVDVDLLARALGWAAEGTVNGVFNITNGDYFIWPNVWPAIAAALGMDVGEHRPTALARELPGRSAQWAELVDRHGLRAPRDIVRFVGMNSMVYADQLLSGFDPPEGPVLNSTIAVRQAGFGESMDTEDMFRKWFSVLRDNQVLSRT